jgi:hypothetical protein
MLHNTVNDIFTNEVLKDLLPPQLSGEFFEALYGDADEGAYDIKLSFKNYDSGRKLLLFDLEMHERPEKCLACNLTYGLPEVFSRHPLINIQGLVEKIEAHLGEKAKCIGWELGRTQTPASDLHIISLTIRLEQPSSDKWLKLNN